MLISTHGEIPKLLGEKGNGDIKESQKREKMIVS